MPSIHPEISGRLLSYLDGQLDEGLRRQVHEHLEGCGPCSDDLEAMSVLTGALRQTGRDDMTAGTPADRYGCPGPEALTLNTIDPHGPSAEEHEWVSRHLGGCARCQREVNLIRLMRLELEESSPIAVSEDLSARVERALRARVGQEKGAGHQTSMMDRFTSLRAPVLIRVAMGVSLATIVAVIGILYLQRSVPLVAQRSAGEEARGFQAPSPGRTTPEQSAETGHEPALRPVPSPQGPPSPRPSLPAPSVVARIEPPSIPSAPAALPQEPAFPTGGTAPSGRPEAPPMWPGLPDLVPARQRETFKVLILPTATRPAIRSAVATAIQDQIKIVQPSERDFPTEPSVDDLTANRRLGRLYGVRYILEIDVKETRLGFLVVLRAADTETGGIVATRQQQVDEERDMVEVAGQLGRVVQQELETMP